MYIGTAVPNVTLYICDRELRDVPRGEIGELLIGGAQTGMGYVGDAAETSGHFLEIATNGGRSVVYSTGDLVRLSQGGFLEFMGRDDNQVKFRGLRVELGEIEAAVQSSGLCDEAKAIVTDPRESDGRQELIVFVVPLTTPIQLLMDHLAAKLPIDRQPTQIVPVKTLPVTDRGKLDRKQLISVAQERRTSDVSRRNENYSKNMGGTSENNVENLLQGILEITKREYLAEDLWPVAHMDSLAFMDLGLWLLEKGLTFKSHAYQIHGIPLRRLADDLEPVSGIASEENLYVVPQIAPKDPQQDA
jgi:long-subunit acyl-CoA synthetase (AMP-forming)